MAKTPGPDRTAALGSRPAYLNFRAAPA
jgi:hypothetical protein